MNLNDVSLRLFTNWLHQERERKLGDAVLVGETGGSIFTASDGGERYGIAVSPLFETGGGQWWSDKAQLEDQLAAALQNGAYVLWLPPGGHLPLEEPGRSDFVFRIKMAGARLQAGERMDFKLPVQLGVRKQDDEGSYMSAVGGLQPVWAWFTNVISGVYNLDARPLTRLPEAREEREAIVAEIVEKVKPMQKDDRLAIDLDDSWTLQRIQGDAGFVIVGVPVEELPPEGATRRRLRRLLADATTALAGLDVERRVLLIPGLYLYASEENATIAIRGFDPGVYAPFDYIALVADGTVKPIIAR